MKNAIRIMNKLEDLRNKIENEMNEGDLSDQMFGMVWDIEELLCDCDNCKIPAREETEEDRTKDGKKNIRVCSYCPIYLEE